MAAASFEIRPVNLRAASPAECGSLAVLKNAMRFESLPEDPPWPSEDQMRRFQGMPSIKDNTAWVASSGSREQIVESERADCYLASPDRSLPHRDMLGQKLSKGRINSCMT
jgi:hypothetical protein